MGNVETVRFGADDDEDGSELPRNFSFDWVAYHAALGHTPLQDAVTAMFAEYAVLYGRIAGWATSSAAAPVTLEEGKDIAGHAEDFIIKYVTPILGILQAPKVHKLLWHVLDAIKMHCNLQNGNTGGNEAQRKEDKFFYRRTNKTIKNFTQQNVWQAQGFREILTVMKKEDEKADRLARSSEAAALAAATVGEQAPPPGPELALGGSFRLPSSADDANPSTAAAATSEGTRIERVRLLSRKRVAVLCQRPGLSQLGRLLGRPAVTKLKVLNELRIAARLDCGTMFSQVLRATPTFMNKPWYDAVFMEGDETAPTEDSSPVSRLVCSLVRCVFSSVVLRRTWRSSACGRLSHPFLDVLSRPDRVRACAGQHRGTGSTFACDSSLQGVSAVLPTLCQTLPSRQGRQVWKPFRRRARRPWSITEK